MAAYANNDDGLEELLSELVDAHVDTIELAVGPGSATTLAAHLQYLQGLVRYSKRLIAHRARGPWRY
jgi:hypothetical protein